MASQQAELVVSMMRSANVTSNEALAFMGQALTVMETDTRGSALDFIKELIDRRSSRSFPDLSRHMR